MVSVLTPSKAQKDQLLALDLDMSEHGGKESVGVVLHGKDDEEALRKAGLRWRLLSPDVAKQSGAQRAADRRFATRVARSDFPSGRDTYRTLADYNAELKALAAAEPQPRPADHAAEQDVDGQGRPRHRDHRERHTQRRQAGVRERRRPPCARVALGRARDGVGDRADQRLQERQSARDQHRPQQPQHRRADRQCGRLRGVAQRGRRAGRGPRRGRRRHGLPRLGRRDRRRVPAQELPPPRRLGGRQLHHLGRAGRERRRPEPQLRRPVGRPRRGPEQPAGPDLPRARARSPSPSRATSRRSSPATR